MPTLQGETRFAYYAGIVSEVSLAVWIPECNTAQSCSSGHGKYGLRPTSQVVVTEG